MEEAVAMAQIAAGQGTKVLLATPHMKDVNELSSVEHAWSVFHELSEQVENAGIPITLAMGMENHVVPGLPLMFLRGEALTINDSKYALIEMPFFEKPAYLEQTLFSILDLGIIPVLAHPERIKCIQDDIEFLARFVEQGMLSQITAGSLLGHFGNGVRWFTEQLLYRNLAHVMASDTHRPVGTRPPNLREGLVAATKLVGAESSQSLINTIPKSILEGLAVELPCPPLT